MTYQLVARETLTEEDLAQLPALEQSILETDGIQIKLNRSMMARRPPGYVNDLCIYTNDQLVAYMPIDDFGGDFEVTALVHSDHRRRGLFRQLYPAARRNVRERGGRQLLLVGFRESASAQAVAARLDAPYDFSEYRMEADAADIPPLPPIALTLSPVTPERVDDLSRLMTLSFGAARWHEPAALREEVARGERRYYLAHLETEPIGQIGVLPLPEETYLCALGIIPDRRRQGYGRQMLAQMVHQLLSEGRRRFSLDVATGNADALALYRACGFREQEVFDYYRVPLGG